MYVFARACAHDHVVIVQRRDFGYTVGVGTIGVSDDDLVEVGLGDAAFESTIAAVGTVVDDSQPWIFGFEFQQFL